MVQKCAVPSCRSTYSKDRMVSWHRLPKDPERNLKWQLILKSLHEDNHSTFKLSSNTAVCSKHFPKDAYNISGRLQFNAIPSIFHCESANEACSIEALCTTSSSATLEVASTLPQCASPHHVSASSSCATEEASTPSTLAVAHCSQQSAMDIDMSVEEVVQSEELYILTSNHQEGSPTSPLAALNANTSGVGLTTPQSKPRKLYLKELSPSDFSTPRKARLNLEIAKHELAVSRKRVKSYWQKMTNAKKKAKNLMEMLTHLKDKRHVNEELFNTLKLNFGGPVSAILDRALHKKPGVAISEELRQFALTLNFHSSSAYNYVRETFMKSLPDPRTLSRWYAAVDCVPGFTVEAAKAIKCKASEAAVKGKKMFCSLIVDEMSIRKNVCYVGNQLHGLVNHGTGVQDDSLPAAKEATTFMLVAINDSWKIPVGYFFISSLNASERANLVDQCLDFVSDTGAEVVSLTFDGTVTNFAMANILGAILDTDGSTSFIHKATGKPVYIFLDPCHMLKLVRNTFGASRTLLKDSDGNIIDWKFVEELVKFQEAEGLVAANKLSRRHLNWATEKMRVRLAAQTLSSSVADALDYLEFALIVPAFLGSAPTAKFIRLFNDLFDVLNSRNLLQKGLKAPLSRRNIDTVRAFLLNAKTYILGLTDNGMSILHSPRKTGFRGFLVCIDSALHLYEYLVEKNDLIFLPLYKISQDHLEMFFSWIRSRGGHNNNPSTVQFTAAYKRLLTKIQLSSKKSANCWPLELISILHISSTPSISVSYNNSDEAPNLDDPFNVNVASIDHSYCDNVVQPVPLSSFAVDIVQYIAGFVGRSVARTFPCSLCCYALFGNDDSMAFIKRKNRGGLMVPSEDVFKLCELAEKELRLCYVKNNALTTKFSVHVNNIKRKVDVLVFKCLDEHILDQSPLMNHKSALVNCVIRRYLEIRLRFDAAKYTEKLVDVRIRSVNTKIVLFKNQ